MEFIDFDDSQKLWEFAQETIDLAEKYQRTRTEYAEAIKTIKIELAKAYSTQTIKESISEDKAYLQLLNINPDLKQVLEDLIEYEQVYKGLEKVLEARQALVSLNQSIIKNQANNS
jgi:predicted component of viral defense system (DUF524 family)